VLLYLRVSLLTSLTSICLPLLACWSNKVHTEDHAVGAIATPGDHASTFMPSYWAICATTLTRLSWEGWPSEIYSQTPPSESLLTGFSAALPLDVSYPAQFGHWPTECPPSIGLTASPCATSLRLLPGTRLPLEISLFSWRLC
jgi:hypothetical protein